jgi:hypothetical protein
MWKAWRRWPIRKAYNAGDWSTAASLARRELTTGNRAFAQDIILRSLYNQQEWQEILSFLNEHPEADDGTYERRARLKLAQIKQVKHGEPIPEEDRPWNDKNLLSNWLQEGHRVWMRHPWGWTHWDMPEDYSLAKTHPSLLHLAMQMLLGQWVPATKQWSVEPREPGKRLGLAYSGGVDSTAALLLLPDDTILAYHQRNFDSMLSHTLPMATFDAIKKRMGRKVLCIPSNHERIRTYHSKVNGFSDAHAVGVHLILLADHLDLAGIAFGTPIDNTWLKRGSVFRDFSTDPYWTKSRAMFAKAGLAYVLPINHISEAGALEVCRRSELADVVNSCLRGLGKRWCGRCWKCFHKNGPLGREFDPTASEITTFLNTKPLRTAQHALWALRVQQLEHLAPHLAPFLESDLSWWVDTYPPGLELIDEPWRTTVVQRSDAVLKRMIEPYPLESVHLDTSSW